MTNMSLSPKAASKPIHKFNIWLSAETKEALNAKIRELKLANTPKTKSCLVSEAIEFEYHGPEEREGLTISSEMLKYRTTVYLKQDIMQMVFDLEQHYYSIRRITASKIINSALKDYLKD